MSRKVHVTTDDHHIKCLIQLHDQVPQLPNMLNLVVSSFMSLLTLI